MPTWTSLSTKTTGNSITKAEMEDLMGNIEFLRTRSSFRMMQLQDADITVGGAFSTATPTLIDIDGGASTRWVEWDTDTVIAGTTGTDIEVGDGRAGIWLVGAGTKLSYTGSAIAYDRRILVGTNPILWESGGSVKGNDGTPLDRKQSSTLWEFAATDDVSVDYNPVDPQDIHELTKVKGTHGRVPTYWGLWVGSGDLNTDDYIGTGWNPGSHTNVIDWWNDMVADLERLYDRPAAALRKTTDQTGLATDTWHNVSFDTTDFDTDSMVTGSTFVSNRESFYYVSFGVLIEDYEEYDSGSWAGGVPAYHGLGEIRLVVDEGLGTEQTLDQVGMFCGSQFGGTDVEGDKGIHSEGIIKLEQDETLTVQFRLRDPASQYSATTLLGSYSTFFRICEVSSESTGGGANRQFFLKEEKLPTKINFENRDETIMPLGQVQAITRDYINFLINPPVIILELEEDVEIQGNNATALPTKVPFNFVELDNWGIYEKDAVPSSELILPITGLWLITTRITWKWNADVHNDDSTIGEEEGGNGGRGRRSFIIRHNGRGVGGRADDSPGHPEWEFCHTGSALVVAQAGDAISVDAGHGTAWSLMLASRAADNTRGDCRLAAAWLGDQYTWERHRDSGTPV